jgi:hypothetical protein
LLDFSAAQLAGMDQAHEQITDLGTVQGAIEQCVLSMKNRALQRRFCDVIAQRGRGFAEKQLQRLGKSMNARIHDAQMGRGGSTTEVS